MNSKVCCAVLGLFLVALCSAGPVVDDNSPRHIDNSVHVNEPSNIEETLMKKLNAKCTNSDVSSCMMLKLVTYFNRLLKKSSIEFGDVQITQTSAEVVTQDTSRSINTENMSEEAQLTEVVANKLWSFVKTRSLKWKVTDDADVVVSGGNGKDGSFNFGFSVKPNPSSEGDARKKKDNGLGAIVGAVALKIGLLKALAFKGLALLVGKALLVSKLALVLALVIGLKKLLSHGKYVTYEVVAHPHHEHHHDHSFSGGGHDGFGHGVHGGHGWGRSAEAAEMAYKGQKPSA
ncbi:hypothetical protein RN001_011975 [Aquatica leii]|uniref:Osiris 7 n=1 Tax=Aquatica leii TaxID=1421715 RepID=A0AAN7QEC8_9COLE|nr:hypothetical protein RN001_011975 [Aquatica leii]